MTISRKKSPPPIYTAIGESGARQSQDDNPLNYQETVRTASVDYGNWSHLSLHSRCGTRLSTTRPQLAKVNLPPSITPRPFGLGWRFDRSPSSNADPSSGVSRWKLLTKSTKRRIVSTSHRSAQASCDTHPKGGDEGNTLAPFMGSAVGAAETPKHLFPQHIQKVNP